MLLHLDGGKVYGARAAAETPSGFCEGRYGPADPRLIVGGNLDCPELQAMYCVVVAEWLNFVNCALSPFTGATHRRGLIGNMDDSLALNVFYTPPPVGPVLF